MPHVGFLALYTLFVICPIGAHSQDSVAVVAVDSLKKVRVGLYGDISIRMSSSYVRKFDSEALSSSSGVSIFNALRGRVPGLTIPAYFDLANASGLRTGPFTFAYDALLGDDLSYFEHPGPLV